MTKTKLKNFKEEDRIKDLGDKICRLVYYYEKGKGRNLELAALASIFISIKEIFKIYDKKFKELEENNLEHHEINETGGVNKIKIILGDPILKKERG